VKLKALWIFALLFCVSTANAQSTTIDAQVSNINAQLKAGAITSDQAYHLLDIQYRAAESMIWATRDLPSLEMLNKTEESIFQTLTAMNFAKLKADDAEIDAALPVLQQANAELGVLAYKKWCHQTPWRAIRGYRKPAFCGR
jgi:hypothetical protein